MRDVYYASTREGDFSSAMVYDGRWKYIYSAANATEELYDQKQDIKELCNLALDRNHEPRLLKMRTLLIEQASAWHDHNLLRDGELIRGSVDRDAIRAQKVGSSMGWRWY